MCLMHQKKLTIAGTCVNNDAKYVRRKKGRVWREREDDEILGASSVQREGERPRSGFLFL